MNDDTILLQQYTRQGSDQAFRELVERHIQLVNSTAVRMVAGDVHLAQDVTQLVFTDLARKAATLPEDVLLGGWLHRHTCFTAAKAIRTECRRRARERTAMEIHALNDNTGLDAHWQKLAPVLDDALNNLGEQDRHAIVLRYLQRQDLRSVGRALGASDDAAQKRVTRALDKLRGFLGRRGIALSTTLLASTLDASTAAPVPHGLTATVSASALSNAASGTSFTLTSTLSKMITSKLAIGVAAVIAIGGVTAVVINQTGSDSSAPAPASSVAASTVAATKPTVAMPVIKTAAAQVEAPQQAVAPVANVPFPVTPTNNAAVANGGAPATFSTNRVFSAQAGNQPGQSQVTTLPGQTATLSVNSVNGQTPAFSRQVSVNNNQVTVTTTDANGNVRTETSDAPPPGAVVMGGQGKTMVFKAGTGQTFTSSQPGSNVSTGQAALMNSLQNIASGGGSGSATVRIVGGQVIQQTTDASGATTTSVQDVPSAGDPAVVDASGDPTTGVLVLSGSGDSNTGTLTFSGDGSTVSSGTLIINSASNPNDPASDPFSNPSTGASGSGVIVTSGTINMNTVNVDTTNTTPAQ